MGLAIESAEILDTVSALEEGCVEAFPKAPVWKCSPHGFNPEPGAVEEEDAPPAGPSQ